MKDQRKNYLESIPAYVQEPMQLLKHREYEAYLVGGAVRDLLLGSAPADFDVATNATPAEVETVFADYTLIPTGVAHGTMTLIIENHAVEITTYRIDGDYSDSRRPDQVYFSRSLEEDVKRRDFTINALALDQEGQVIDFVGGQQDLQAGLIRCVGDPNLRFQEDALRILRGLRFASVLEFSVEESTRQGLFTYKQLLEKVSAERVWAEFSRLICGGHSSQVVFEYVDILGEIIPELLPMKNFDQHNPYHKYDVFQHTVVAVQNTPPRIALRLAALFHDIGKPLAFTRDDQGVGHFFGHQKISRDMTRDILLRLKSDKNTREYVEELVLWHDISIEPNPRILRRRLNRFGKDMLFDLILLKRADTLAQSDKARCRLDELAKSAQILEEILAAKDCFTLKDLAISGKDLVAVGFSPGKEIGQLLQLILLAVMDETVANDKDALLSLAKAELEKRCK